MTAPFVWYLVIYVDGDLFLFKYRRENIVNGANVVKPFRDGEL